MPATWVLPDWRLPQCGPTLPTHGPTCWLCWMRPSILHGSGRRARRLLPPASCEVRCPQRVLSGQEAWAMCGASERAGRLHQLPSCPREPKQAPVVPVCCAGGAGPYDRCTPSPTHRACRIHADAALPPAISKLPPCVLPRACLSSFLVRAPCRAFVRSDEVLWARAALRGPTRRRRSVFHAKRSRAAGCGPHVANAPMCVLPCYESARGTAGGAGRLRVGLRSQDPPNP